MVCIFFSSERPAATPKWLLRLPLLLASVTRAMVAEGKLF